MLSPTPTSKNASETFPGACITIHKSDSESISPNLSTERVKMTNLPFNKKHGRTFLRMLPRYVFLTCKQVVRFRLHSPPPLSKKTVNGSRNFFACREALAAFRGSHLPSLSWLPQQPLHNQPLTPAPFFVQVVFNFFSQGNNIPQTL